MDKLLLNDLITQAQTKHLHILNVTVRQHNKQIAKHDFAEEQATLLWSVSKSVTSLVAGIAMAEGYFKLSDYVIDFFPEMEEKAKNNTYLRIMTVHDLLSMGTGQVECPVSKADWQNKPDQDITELFFNEPVVYEPGTYFMYNNAATYMISRIIGITTGKLLDIYAYEKLFEPLGIEMPVWDKCPKGIPQGFSGLRLTITDLSKIGQLVLDAGVWDGKQVVSSDYIHKATSKQIDTKHFDTFFATADHHQGYGYQFWMNSYIGSFRMDGFFGQYVVILPDKDAVVTYISNEKRNMIGILELTWNTLIAKL